MRVRKGVCYWPTFQEARDVRDRVKAEHPEARVVHYGLGWAVQLRVSGPYVGRDDL